MLRGPVLVLMITSKTRWLEHAKQLILTLSTGLSGALPSIRSYIRDEFMIVVHISHFAHGQDLMTGIFLVRKQMNTNTSITTE